MDVFESVEVRDKYYPVEDATAMSEIVKANQEKMKALIEERGKYVLFAARIYTDWIIK